MRIVIAGGTGFLGRPLAESLGAAGHEVLVLSRQAPPAARPGHVWNGVPGVRAAAWTAGDDLSGWGHVVDGADAIVNLAGESIAARRWSDDQKARMRVSRLDSTRALGQAMEGRVLFRGGLEAAHHFHAHRPGGHAPGKSLKMLLDQDGRGRQQRDLFSIHHRLEGGPHGHFGFSIADIAAN